MSVTKEDADAWTQLTPPDARAIDDGPVGRLQVLNDPFAIVEDKPRMVARDARFIDYDVAGVVAPDQEF